jgi:hypothetical protein
MKNLAEIKREILEEFESKCMEGDFGSGINVYEMGIFLSKTIDLMNQRCREVVEEEYQRGFEDGTHHRSEQILKIRELRKQGKSYGEIKRELGIKWTNSIVHALKERSVPDLRATGLLSTEKEEK